MPRQGKDRILLISSPPKGKERPSFPSSDDRQARREGRGRAREREISEGSHALIAQAIVYISPSGLRVRAPKRSAHGRVRTLSAEQKKTEPVVGSVSFVRKMMEGSSLTGGRIVWLSPIGRVALSCK